MSRPKKSPKRSMKLYIPVGGYGAPRPRRARANVSQHHRDAGLTPAEHWALKKARAEHEAARSVRDTRISAFLGAPL